MLDGGFACLLAFLKAWVEGLPRCISTCLAGCLLAAPACPLLPLFAGSHPTPGLSSHRGPSLLRLQAHGGHHRRVHAGSGCCAHLGCRHPPALPAGRQQRRAAANALVSGLQPMAGRSCRVRLGVAAAVATALQRG